ncbi:hypothetical protein EDB92DRAFT_1939797 [Lactarius akahatsu]|uniref:Uncharacterized protein n=1 Tax=Lactarius akahatsu TaxID=416441 RepID=A0AAD4LRN9_9AGAM|nr:hypothetical protein EDB92DRAFT_1939797 [Lactarius akahatsu]
MPPPLADGQVLREARESLLQEEQERIRLFPEEMQSIKDAVKAEIFANLNQEALANLDEWRAVYKHKFVEAMHNAFEAQYPGIHPTTKGKAPANPPPLTLSQVIRDAEPQIREEVQRLVDARIHDIHHEVRASIANGESFWKEGPIREGIAQEIRAATKEDLNREMAAELETLRHHLIQEHEEVATEWCDKNAAKITAMKEHFKHEAAQSLEEWKRGVQAEIKAWKVKYRNGRELSALRREATRMGFLLTQTDGGATDYTLAPLKVDGRELTSSPPSRATSPAPSLSQPTTPPPVPLLTDPNVTPTPVRVKRIRTDDAPPPPLALYPLSPAHPSTSLPTPADAAMAAPLPPPTPMEEDLEYAAEVWAESLETKNPGLLASIHAPLAHPSPLPAHNPSAPPQATALAALAEQPATAPLPGPILAPPPRLEPLTPAPPAAASVDGLAAVLEALNATITRLERKIDDGLNAQSKRIDALTRSTDPRPRPGTAGTAKASRAVAAPSKPNTKSRPAPPAMEETPRPYARVDDPAVDSVPELFTEGASSNPAPVPSTPTVVCESFQPPADKLIRLETDARGKPLPTATMPPPPEPAEVNQALGRTPAGKSRPETLARRKESPNTEVTVIRGHGVDDPNLKLQIYKRAPSAYVAEAHQEVEQIAQGKLILLSGRWSQSQSHNFMYTFQGHVPFEQIFPYRDILVKPLFAGYLVPNDGWTHAQLRDVQTRAPDGTIYDNNALLKELQRNVAFQNAIFCLVPHWQGSPYTVAHKERTTVTMAFVDDKGSVSANAVRAGTYMFNSRVRLIITGDSPTIVMCGRCHAIGHTTGSPACLIPVGSFRCARCGGSHHTEDHDTHCNGRHEKAGICNCFFCCLNCNGNHGTQSAACPLKKGFTPPDLVPRNDPAIVRTPPSAKGKGKAPAAPPEDLIPTQRDQPPAAGASDGTSDGFTTVTRRPKGNGSAKTKAWAARNATRSTVPTRPLTAASPAPRPSTLAAQAKDGPKARNPPPSPPSVADAPVIGEQHVATMQETIDAIARITKSSTDLTRDQDLRAICNDWKRIVEDDDAFGTLVACIPFRYAVRYHLPLTTPQTTATITKDKSVAAARDAINEFIHEWTEVSPFFYALASLQTGQTFVLLGESLEPPVDPETKAKEVTAASALITSCIAIHEFESPEDHIPILQDTITSLATTYPVPFFRLTAQNDLWRLIAEYQSTILPPMPPPHA